MDKGGTQINELDDKKVDDFSHSRDDIDRLDVSGKEVENLPALKIIWMHKYEDSKTTLKNYIERKMVEWSEKRVRKTSVFSLQNL